MSEKAAVEIGAIIKIERSEKGWVATVSGPNNSSHSGKPFHHHPTFDDAVAFIKETYAVS